MFAGSVDRLHCVLHIAESEDIKTVSQLSLKMIYQDIKTVFQMSLKMI